MTTGSIFTKNGFNAMLNRTWSGTTYTIPSKFGIGTGTTTPAQTDSALATPITAWSGGSNYKTFVAGYPSLDTTNQKVTTQCFVSSTEANANTITECGDFNTDGTPILFGRSVFTGITKTSSVQMYVTTVYKRV